MHDGIKTVDHGCFIPLLNATYAGGQYLVRLMLGHRVDWKKVGTAHYRKGLNHTNFEVLTREGWAQKKGFD